MHYMHCWNLLPALLVGVSASGCNGSAAQYGADPPTKITLFSVFHPNPQAPLFVDEPPPDYYRRNSLQDCRERFFSTVLQNDEFTGVYNGEPATVGEFNFFAAIGWTGSDKTVKYKCGGTLITLNFVLTAAHCAFDDLSVQPDTVRLGDVDLKGPSNDQNAQQIKIKTFTRHPEFRPSKAYSDIGLIELSQSARASPYVCTACLWTAASNPDYTMTLMGFGAVAYAAEPSSVLRKATTMRVIDSGTCASRLLPNRRLPQGIADQQFCTVGSSQDACEGDSGGPLVVYLSDVDKLIPFVVGITSLGTGCGEGSVGLYTKVSQYISWVQSVTKSNFNQLQCARRSVCREYFKDFRSPVQVQKLSPSCRTTLLRGDTPTGCGGTLIDYRHVLTSAQCVSCTKAPTHVSIHDNIVKVQEVIRHPEFQEDPLENDIALITLEKYLSHELNDRTVLPACLWNQPTLDTSEVFVAATDPTADSYQRLIISSKLIDDQFCGKDQLCSENSVDVIPGVCQYEPGGHVSNYVSTPTQGFIPFIYGVNSEGFECGGKYGTFVATKVEPHFSWIEAVVLNKSEGKVHLSNQCNRVHTKLYSYSLSL
ncbi:acrosin-like [Culex pipiens pallens]|uniref:acrosin-like n=1 Tax=Culex pipiens pallens TaxID=42434 RepID=UPI0022AB0791|nr:acrosin-like [Culex pipiens pallens]